MAETVLESLACPTPTRRQRATKRLSLVAIQAGFRCSVCGGRIRSDNTHGICSLTLECRNAKAEAERRARGVQPRGSRGRSICSIEGCPEIVHAYGLCQTHDVRKRKHGEPGTAEKRGWNRVTIRAGDVCGKWTALEDCSSSTAKLRCRCECGTVGTAKAGRFAHGEAVSCGCTRRGPRARTEPYIRDGTKLGHLTAIEDAWRALDRAMFRCDCGSETSRIARTVRVGSAQSCGCDKYDGLITHGLSQHPLYPTWAGMICRTTNPAAHNYPLYGGRGITVCERWQGSASGLANFIADVGPKPSRKHSLDRIDNEGNYEPGNVKWSTPPEQAGNRRTIAGLTAERDALLVLLAEAQSASGRLF